MSLKTEGSSANIRHLHTLCLYFFSKGAITKLQNVEIEYVKYTHLISIHHMQLVNYPLEELTSPLNITSITDLNTLCDAPKLISDNKNDNDNNDNNNISPLVGDTEIGRLPTNS